MTPDQHLTEARRMLKRSDEQNDGAWAMAQAQAATTHAILAMAEAQSDQAATIAQLRAELDEALALSEERRAALHYVIYPDEGRTVHPTTGRLRELATPDE